MERRPPFLTASDIAEQAASPAETNLGMMTIPGHCA
jgi:hypothetical protein